MTAVNQSRSLRFCEMAFSFNFIAFAFVMFSCWFPTGFSATFSTFAFLFALPLFFYRLDLGNISLFEKAGLALFGWLLVSISWSQVDVLDSLRYLSEYRLYFMVPIFSAALLCLPNTQKWAFCAAVSGAIVALIASYGLGLGWWAIDGAENSLANRIYHGFIMACLFLFALLVARESSGITRLSALLVALLTVYNVLNIETGRTGYLLMLTVSSIFLLLSFKRLQALMCGLLLALILGVGYLSLDRFKSEVDKSFASLEQALVQENYQSSIGHRLDFYRGALLIGLDNPLGGVGVGDVVPELQNRFEKKDVRHLTDNIHSEYLNMLVAGGVPALILFVLFVSSITWVGFRHRKIDRLVGDALIGVSVIIFTAALFNSTIKDYGEKHALLVILSVLVSVLIKNERALSKKPSFVSNV